MRTRLKPSDKDYGCRVVKRFLLSPLTLPVADSHHRDRVWLESAKIVQIWEAWPSGWGGYWRDDCWYVEGMDLDAYMMTSPSNGGL